MPSFLLHHNAVRKPMKRLQTFETQLNGYKERLGGTGGRPTNVIGLILI